MTGFDRILVINLGGIGDLVLSVPFLRGIRRSFPASRLELLAAGRAAGVIDGLPYFDRLRTIDTEAMTPLKALLRPIGAASCISQFTRMKIRHYDLAVNLMPMRDDHISKNMPAILSYIGAGRAAGRNTAGRGAFYDISVDEPDVPEIHDTDVHAGLLSEIGGEPDRTRRLELGVPSTGDLKDVAELLGGLPSRKEGPIVGICAGASRKTRIWPADRFAAVMDSLHESANASFVLLGDNNDCMPATKVLKKASAPAIDTCGKTSLKRLVALVGRLNMLITNEAGPMFVAAALGLPTVALIGPGHSRRFTRESDSIHVMRRDTDCAPCDRTECDDMKCLDSIPAEEVAEAALGLLVKR